MGASYQHPSALQIKFRIRADLGGKDCELVRSNHNTDKENHDITLSEMSFSQHDAGYSENDTSDHCTLDPELLISAMLFSSDLKSDGEEGITNVASLSITEGVL